MVTELQRSTGTIYVCQICGFGYGNLETAEHCERHCDTESYSSSKIRQKVIYQPNVQFIPTAS